MNKFELWLTISSFIVDHCFNYFLTCFQLVKMKIAKKNFKKMVLF